MFNLNFTEVPALFGPFHIGMALVVILTAILIFIRVSGQSESQLIRLMHVLGLIMILAEVWKQWFCLRYVYPGGSLWFFPWQLCSMAMYCSFFMIYVKEKYQNVLLVFLCSFSFFSAIIALAVPADMLRPQIPLTLHGFIYHGIIILESLIAVLILKQRRARYAVFPRQAVKISFANAAFLYLIMSVIAEIINCIGHYLLPDHLPEPDMFYITPFYPSTQPVCADVAERFGIPAEIVIYSCAIILLALMFYLVVWYLTKTDKSPDA